MNVLERRLPIGVAVAVAAVIGFAAMQGFVAAMDFFVQLNTPAIIEVDGDRRGGSAERG